MTLTAIETRYKGYRFRSRLEARWAVFFDAMRVSWEYEAQGYVLPDGTHYLPDFYFTKMDEYAEIKPQPLTDEASRRCAALASVTKRRVLLLVGAPGEEEAYEFQPGQKPGEVDLFSEDDSVDLAYAAARSARFEHGESGAIKPPQSRADQYYHGRMKDIARRIDVIDKRLPLADENEKRKLEIERQELIDDVRVQALMRPETEDLPS